MEHVFFCPCVFFTPNYEDFGHVYDSRMDSAECLFFGRFWEGIFEVIYNFKQLTSRGNDRFAIVHLRDYKR